MSDNKLTIKPIAVIVGAAFLSSLAISTTTFAADNPFSFADLDTGYLLADNHGAEGKCGEDKGKEGKCGEGKCGEDKGKEGACGEHDGKEGKCGEGKCGENKGKEGKCGEDKGKEGSCGESEG